MSNKTLKKEYIVAAKDVQDHYYYVLNGGKVEDIKKALAYLNELPVLNKRPIKILNRKGIMIATVGRKGTLRKFVADYNRKTWYIDGNRLGKRKRLLIEAYFNDDLIKTINQDGLEIMWKRVSHRINY